MIYDCFIFNDEFDILEIRLAELSGIVDKFVIVESATTFQGNDKPLYFSQNRERFAKYNSQIIHVVCQFPDNLSMLYSASSDDWRREFYQRDSISKGLKGLAPDDLVIVSDVDEIVAARALKRALESRRPSEITAFTMPLYRYYFNRRLKNYTYYSGPRMTAYRYFKTAQQLRCCAIVKLRRIHKLGLGIGLLLARWSNIRHYKVFNPMRELRNGGWHFSSIGSWSDFRKKSTRFVM